MLTIGLVSPGAMGGAIGARLVWHGARVLTQLDGRSAASIARAQAGGMTDAAPADLAGADIFLSIVPPHTAEEVARSFAAWASGVARPALYIDCNALSPATKQSVAGIVEGAGARMVDACIIGGPRDEGGPNFYASGAHAADAAILGEHGLRWSVLDAPIGAAASLKMCFAGINKGLLALGNMMQLAAVSAGVSDALRSEMEARLPHVLSQFDRTTHSVFERAWRWAPEMREIAEFGTTQAGAPDVFEGFALFYERLAADFAGARSDHAALVENAGVTPAKAGVSGD
jgi:3-hydroxyisobutyrate dehydrogenase-like beta-hydroxyacid dehydrogenase